MGSVLIFASIVINKWGYRFGVPTLLLFLFTSMLFGSDGLGLATEEPKTGNDFGVELPDEL